jgi:hypothetical protein
LESQMINNWALHCFNNYVNRDSLADGEHRLSFVEDNPAIYTTVEGAKIRATRMILTPTYVVDRKFFPFEFRTYFDRARSRSLIDAAVALVEVGGASTNLVLSKDATGVIKVSLIPSAKAIAKSSGRTALLCPIKSPFRDRSATPLSFSMASAACRGCGRSTLPRHQCGNKPCTSDVAHSVS